MRIAREKRFKSARAAGKAMGIAVSTYGAHERAEAPGGRDYGPNEALRYGRFFGVTPEWLLTGRKPFPSDEPEQPPARKVRVVGYVGAGAEAHLYAVAQGDLDEVDPPPGLTEDTVAVEIRGDSLGAFFNRWLVFYDDVRRPVTPDLIGELCIVGLEDGRILIKQIQRSKTEGLFNLISSTEKPIADVAIEWAARVNSIGRRSRT
ncbi:MAG: XRE family transcriptional regulator [Xanthobacteraceae bacterium]|nr:helix-turn-helix transcriptional regulator [Xanthobacteraceae bacterium]